MRTYKTQVKYDGDKRRGIQAHTNATTRIGVMRALGKAAARELDTAAFVCTGLMWREGKSHSYNLSDWHHDRSITADELLQMRYAANEELLAQFEASIA